MKKLVACLLLFACVLSIALTGCKEEMVTIYIPDTVTVYDSREIMQSRMRMVYEEGWQNKETFVAQHVYSLGNGQYKVQSTTYGDKTAVLYYGGSALVSIEEHYDEKGRRVQEILHYADGYMMKNQTNTSTYDSNGRITSEKIVRDGEEVVNRTFTCEMVEGNYVCTAKANDGVTREMIYNEEGQLLKDITYLVGGTDSCWYTYDENGCQVTKLRGSLKTVTTYIAVEVPISIANRLPQFVRAK